MYLCMYITHNAPRCTHVLYNTCSTCVSDTADTTSKKLLFVRDIQYVLAASLHLFHIKPLLVCTVHTVGICTLNSTNVYSTSNTTCCMYMNCQYNIRTVTHREKEAAFISGSRIPCNMLGTAEPATTTPHAVPASRRGS